MSEAAPVSNISSSTPLPSRIEVRLMPEYGVDVDGVWIPMSFLEELREQGVYDSQFGGSLGTPSRETERVLEARGLLERETRGGVHLGPALAVWLDGLTWPERAAAPVSGPPEADSRPYRKFNVGAAGRSRVYMRCWVCGTPAEFGRPDEWVGLEELTGWADGHVCPRNLAVA